MITVIGAGLAGCEAALAAAGCGVSVRLLEMKPKKFTPAHKYPGFGELVCSNSLKAKRPESAAGLLKAEMEMLGSAVVAAAKLHEVGAGGALAVDREGFSDALTEAVNRHPLITVETREAADIPKEGIVIVATGPLTSEPLAEKIRTLCGNGLSFYDAAAPIVTAASIDMEKAFWAARYDRGEADYINCPFTKEEYLRFYRALVEAETVVLKDFEIQPFSVYEGCMPIEVLAKRGEDTMRFGPLKPVGLRDPKTGKRPYAVVQLRKENSAGTLFNLVGFQTNLKFPEQKRVFSMIPGLENAEFMRYGVMHRNTFLNAPDCLDEYHRLKNDARILFAGQITGVEGYIESSASGIYAGYTAARMEKGLLPIAPPETTMLGALIRHTVDTQTKDYQPMGCNMGILPPLDKTVKGKQERYGALAERSLADMKEYVMVIQEGLK